jgi:glycine/D-amino acid oxidase-like deaminating enzyme
MRDPAPDLVPDASRGSVVRSPGTSRLELTGRGCENDPKIQRCEELPPPLSRVSPTIGLGRIGWGIGSGAGFSAADNILGSAPQLEDRPLLLVGARCAFS